MSARDEGATASGEAYCATCGRSFELTYTTCPFDNTKLVHFGAAVDPMIGRVLDGRYAIVARLGRGGMGAVYRARQLSVDREVAVKVIHPTFAADRDVAKRFLREARLASSLTAPGIVSVFDFGQTAEGVLYLVMELVAGSTLANEIRDRAPLTTARIVELASQICDALEVAHAAGITHRDLKPSNIVEHTTPTGIVLKVLDFGIAKAEGVTSITATRQMAGTPLYMSPEQFDGRADARSDLYSLGCILYELATGAPPFVESDVATLYIKHSTAEPAALPGSVPRPLVDVILQLLAKDPADRFASAAEVRDALDRVPGTIGNTPIIRTIASRRLPTPPVDMNDVPETQAGANQPRAVTSSAPTIPSKPARQRRRAGVVIAALGALAVAAAVLAIVVNGSDRDVPANAGATRPSPAEIVAPLPADAAIASPRIEDASVASTSSDASVATPPIAPPKRHTRPRPKPRKPTDTDLPFVPVAP